MNQKPKRVLVVDDDQTFLEVTRTALENRGYEVLTACDGHEGLIRAESERLDLIVLDVMLPRRSGFGVLDHIGSRGQTGPRIVVVSGNDGQRECDIAYSKGADVFLHKPFEMPELLRTVESLLHVSA